MKKCKVCRKKFEAWNSLQVVCSPGCALKLAKKQTLEREKADRKRLREKRNILKPISQLKSEAQSAFNRFIRLRDFDAGCISCGRSREEVESGPSLQGGYWDAGHYKSRGARPMLRFVESNVHKQCKKCNGGSGKFSAKEATVTGRYRDNLVEKIGLEQVEWLEGPHEEKKYKPDELREIKRKYNAKANKLQKIIEKTLQ